MPFVRRVFSLAVILASAGCQVPLPPYAFVECRSSADCSTNAQCSDAGRCVDGGTNAGSDGGPDAGDAGEDAGFDAGDAGPDAGSPDAGASDAGPPDSGASDGGLFCNDWSCVRNAWPDAGANAEEWFGFPPVDPGPASTYAWFGGVLLPNGKVLGVPHQADHALLIDPVARTATAFGALLPADGGRRWTGAVLGPDGFVYALPSAETQLLRYDWRDGGTERWGPVLALDGGAPRLTGGAVDRYGTLWAVSENEAVTEPVFRFDLTDGGLKTFAVGPGLGGGWWGLSRTLDDRLVAFPKERYTDAGSRRVLEIAPGAAFDSATLTLRFEIDAEDAGLALSGAALDRDGNLFSTPASPGLPRTLTRFADGGLAVVAQEPIALGTIGSHGNGCTYTTPALGLYLRQCDGQKPTLLDAGFASDQYGFLGWVATPEGLVAIPGTQSQAVMLRPSAKEPRALPVLLSPYFNRL